MSEYADAFGGSCKSRELCAQWVKLMQSWSLVVTFRAETNASHEEWAQTSRWQRGAWSENATRHGALGTSDADAQNSRDLAGMSVAACGS